MRDFKFRAFNKTTKEMYWNVFLDTGFYNHQYESNGVNMKDLEIMQYSGLKDKNGKEIYEGDIVKVTDLWRDNWTGRVWWDKWQCGFMMIDKPMSRYTRDDDDKIFIEILGNIYEHPELLKGE